MRGRPGGLLAVPRAAPGRCQQPSSSNSSARGLAVVDAAAAGTGVSPSYGLWWRDGTAAPVVLDGACSSVMPALMAGPGHGLPPASAPVVHDAQHQRAVTLRPAKAGRGAGPTLP